jgi:exosortase
MSRVPPVPAAARKLAGLNAALLGLLAAALTVYLWPQWRHNPDLSHGFLMPAVFLLLVWEARQRGPFRHPSTSAWTLGGVALLSTAALIGLAAAGLFAVALGWSHSLVSFVLAGALAAALLGGMVALAAEPLRWVPLNWTTVVAALLWLLTAPLPPGTYTRLMLRLQIWVTGNVLAALHVLGVAARQRGNLIELAGSTVGIEEACSGMRSLIACVFAGAFFSAWLVRRPAARVVLLLLAAPLAILMNFARSLTLTLLANANVDIAGFWHDATGYAVLLLTAGALAGAARLLESHRVEPVPAPIPRHFSEPLLIAIQAVLLGSLLLGCGLVVFFVRQTRPSGIPPAPPPDLASVLPPEAPGWTVTTSGDLYRFADTLQTKHLLQRTYYKGRADDTTQITVYLAYWPAGQTTVTTVALHTPDACWPGVGWTAVPVATSEPAPAVAGRRLPAPEYRLFTSEGYPQHVWFWHLYGGAPITQRDPRSPRELLVTALRFGFRREADQLFVRLSSNRSWSEIGDEPLLAEIFGRLHDFGL